MYICYNCGNEFVTPSIETVQRAGEPSFDMQTCPKCGSYAIEKIPPTSDDYEYYDEKNPYEEVKPYG
jgi:DNA-directed RNA polymerase subunit RPC12/RpoP